MKQTEIIYLGDTTLVPGSPKRMQNDFPLGQMWHRIFLRFTGSITVGGAGSGAVAFANPMLELINNIHLKTDVDGNIINAPAKALYLLAANKYGTLPRIDSGAFDPNTAGTYNMSVSIPLDFTDQRMQTPNDTLIFSGRYSRVDLEATLGAALDVIKVLGTGSLTYTLGAFTMSVELEKQAFAEELLPHYLPRFEVEKSYQNVASGTTVDLGRAFDKSIKRVHVFATALGATASQSRNCQGDGSNAVIAKLAFKDENKYYQIGRSDEAVLDEMKLDRGWDENLPAGHYVLDFVKPGLNGDAISTGDKGTLQFEYEKDSSAPAGNNLVTVCSEALVMLK